MESKYDGRMPEPPYVTDAERELEDCREAQKSLYSLGVWLISRNEALEAEVARLRKALEEIGGHHYLWENFTLQLVHITNTAQQALEASDESD